MTNEEIRKKINENNELLEKIMIKDTFVLNPDAKKILEENKYLQSISKNKFENGKCIYCDRKEK